MKKTLLIILVSLILIAGIGFLILSHSSSAPTMDVSPVADTSTQGVLQDQTKIRQQNVEDINLFNMAIQQKDPKNCTFISNAAKKDECQQTIQAIGFTLSGNIDSCDTLTLTGVATTCRMTIQQNNAIAANNKALCVKISDTSMRTHCRETIDQQNLLKLLASKTATPEACNQLESKFQSQCMAAVTQINDSAIYNSSAMSGSIDGCMQVSDPTEQTACRDMILMKQAIANKSINSCALLSDASKKDICISRIKTASDAQLFQTYIVQGNIDACSSLSDKTLANRCHDTIVLARVHTSKDSTLCQTLTNTGMLLTCQNLVQ